MALFEAGLLSRFSVGASHHPVNRRKVSIIDSRGHRSLGELSSTMDKGVEVVEVGATIGQPKVRQVQRDARTPFLTRHCIVVWDVPCCLSKANSSHGRASAWREDLIMVLL